MNKILVFHGFSAAFHKEIDDIRRTYEKVSNSSFLSKVTDHLSDIDRICAAAPCDLLFLGRPLEMEEAGLLNTFFEEKNQKILQVVCTSRTGLSLEGVPKDRVISKALRLKPRYILDAICFFLGQRDPDLDRKVLGTMIQGVADVINKSVDLNLELGELDIQESACPSITDYSNMGGFFGDGVMVTMLVKSHKELLRAYIEKLVGGGQHKDDMFLDAIHEISNQVGGYIRKTIHELGYDLNTTFQIAVAGPGHTVNPVAVGKVFQMSFYMGEYPLKVLLFVQPYNRDIYTNFVDQDVYRKKVLDVRALTVVNQCVRYTMKQYSSDQVVYTGANPADHYRVNSNSVLVAHGVGHQGTYTFLFQLGRDFSTTLGTILFGEDGNLPPQSAIELEFVNQITGLFRKKMRDFDYEFRQIFMTNFEHPSPIACKPTAIGKPIRLNYRWKDIDFHIVFVLNSAMANSYYDVYPHIQSTAS